MPFDITHLNEKFRHTVASMASIQKKIEKLSEKHERSIEQRVPNTSMQLNNISTLVQIENLYKGKILRNIKDNQPFKVIYIDALSIRIAAVEGCRVCLFLLANFKLEEWALEQNNP